MKIIVLVKEVPDTYAPRRLNPETGLLERDGDRVFDEISERALELALSQAEGTGPDPTITALLAGPESAATTLRRALAMGATAAVHLCDEAMLGADLGLTAEALAAAITRAGFDLVIAGDASTDGATGMLPAMLAEHLDVPHLTGLSEVRLGADGVSGVRASDGGTQEVSADYPAVISVTEALPDARLPSFKGIMSAKKKPLETLGLTELGVNPDPLAAPRSILLSVTEKAARTGGVTLLTGDDVAQQLADYLIEHGLVRENDHV